MNRSKDLKSLFKAYMVRKEEESSKPYSYRTREYYNNTFQNKQFSGVIFFYEWSDITRSPLRYFSLSLFEKYLTDSNIELEPWQKDVINNLGEVFITCKPGKKELLIRNSYDGLKSSMAREKSNDYSFPPALCLPQPEAVSEHAMRMSPLYREQYY